jgi:hypothetical protein
MTKTYAVRIENTEKNCMAVMDIKGYSHFSHEKTYTTQPTGQYNKSTGIYYTRQIECVFVFISGTKSEIVKAVKQALHIQHGYWGAVTEIFLAGTEYYSKKY